MSMTLRLGGAPAALSPAAVAAAVATGTVTVVAAVAKGGTSFMIVPGGLPTTVTAPVQYDNRGASLWAATIAGATGTFTNNADATLGYNGFRLRCAPAAQCLARMHYSTSVAGMTAAVARLLNNPNTAGLMFLEANVHLIPGAVDAFHCHIGIASNYSSAGGFLGLYASDAAGPNWQLAFLSGAAAYNFPFPVPQRLIDTGIPFAAPHLVRIEVSGGECRAIIDGVAVAAITNPVLSANEFQVLTGLVPTVTHPQFAISKAAGAETVDFWITDGLVHWGYVGA